MTTIRRSTQGESFVHNMSPPGQRVTYSIIAPRELTRDECFAEVAKFLRTNARPRRGSLIQLRPLCETRTIAARLAEAS